MAICLAVWPQNREHRRKVAKNKQGYAEPSEEELRHMAVACSARASIPTCTRQSTHADRGSRCRHVPNATDDQRSERTSSPSSPSQSSPSSSSFRPATWRELNIDWGRHHLQTLFVDDAHGVLARGAEGVCQRVAKWAGAGHMVFPESAGLDVQHGSQMDADESMSRRTRLHPVCDHPRYAAKPRYAFTDADGACADLVVTCGGADVERRVRAAAPSAGAVLDLWEFAQFADRGEIDGTGIAAIVQRSLALECVAPCIDEAMKLRGGNAWGLPNSSGGVIDEDEMAVARARTVVGVAGLVTFLLAISPLEEVTRVTKR